METTKKDIYLITILPIDEGDEVERLVSATSRSKALTAVALLNKASPADVARVMSNGGLVEEGE